MVGLLHLPSCMPAFYFVFLFPFFLLQCTNYSSSIAVTAPPILISATKVSTTNFTLVVRAANPELIFQGYRLFVSGAESEARNPATLATGTDCTLAAGTLTTLPVQPTQYVFEIDASDTAVASGIACRFRTSVSSGQFIVIRALGLSLQPQTSSNSIRISGPSNSLLLP